MIAGYLASFVNHLWLSTLFAAAAGLLTLAFRKNRASVRYWLWLAASVKFLVPFSPLVAIGSQFEWRAAPAVAPKTMLLPLASAIDDVVQPVALASSAPLPTRYALAILLFIWFCGFSRVIFSWARRWRGIRAVLRTAAPLDLDAPVKIMSSPARLEPGVFGIFRPVLVVPEGILDHLAPEHWGAILAHELCHVRRRDNLTAAIHMAVEAVFWFHPLVWWIGRRLVEQRERACDEEALLASGDPQAYAEGILAVCRMYVESPLACVSGVTGSNLKKRIRGIMENRFLARLSLAKNAALALTGVVAVYVPVAVGLLHAQCAASGVRSSLGETRRSEQNVL